MSRNTLGWVEHGHPPACLSVTVAIALALCLCACGSSGGPRRTGAHTAGARVSTPTPLSPAFGLTEDNADLLWSPSEPFRSPPAFAAARNELTALHPTYLRLLVDWAALQPQPGRAPALAGSVDGCARQVGPCGSYSGIREELAAIASQQRAGGAGAFQVVIDVFGAPAWAAQIPSGCELPGATSFSRPLRASAIAAYRSLIGSLLALARTEGVVLEWWSPWNEPNDPDFISPQHAGCSSDSPAVSPLVYAQLVRAMAAELRAAGGTHHLVLGELNDFQQSSPNTTSIAQFIAALPAEVICLASVWSVHAYATYGAANSPGNGVGALEAALAARGGCGGRAPIWVTEAGAGAPHPGDPRPVDPTAEREGCEALARQLLGWYGDARVQAVFQYSFREDPDFPVGLLSADLSHLYPTYQLWRQWTRRRVADEPPPAPQAACA
jgi:hypothetical protein